MLLEDMSPVEQYAFIIGFYLVFGLSQTIQTPEDTLTVGLIMTASGIFSGALFRFLKSIDDRKKAALVAIEEAIETEKRKQWKKESCPYVGKFEDLEHSKLDLVETYHGFTVDRASLALKENFWPASICIEYKGAELELKLYYTHVFKNEIVWVGYSNSEEHLAIRIQDRSKEYYPPLRLISGSD